MKILDAIVRVLGWLALLALCAWGWHQWVLGWRLPDRWNPLAPLHIAEQPGPFSRYKLSRLDGDLAACLAALSEGAFRFESVPDTEPAPGCGYDNAVRISRTSVALSSPFTLSCPAAVSLALWERHVLQIAAQSHLQRAVTRIDHLGTYACRNIYGRAKGPRSRHASADAIDIAGVLLEGGERVRLLDDWKGDADNEGAKSRFLRAARDGACRFFDGVLGPDYNAAHADHLHLERHGARICR